MVIFQRKIFALSISSVKMGGSYLNKMDLTSKYLEGQGKIQGHSLPDSEENIQLSL